MVSKNRKMKVVISPVPAKLLEDLGSASSPYCCDGNHKFFWYELVVLHPHFDRSEDPEAVLVEVPQQGDVQLAHSEELKIFSKKMK